MAKKFELSKDRRYSKNEQRVFRAMPKDGRTISTIGVVNKIYRSVPEPFYSRQVAFAALTSLARKATINKEPFEVVKSSRAGPYPVLWHLAPR